MKFKINIRTAMALAVASGALSALCGCAATTIEHGIPNFAQVSPNVWRGGQPNAEGWKYLHSIGVTHDVKLNTDSEGSDELAWQEGIVVHKFPIPISQQIFGPSKDKIEDAVFWATEYPSGVFIHCSRGRDRTGLVVATYLHEVEGWPKEKARADMLAHGFHRSLIGLNWYWREKVK